MAARREPVPAWPFSEWLNDRAAYWVVRVGGRDQDAALRHVAGECGWPGNSGLRKLYRYRYQQRSTSVRDERGRRKSDIPTITFPRDVVEEALHHAGEDFAGLFVGYADRFQGSPGRPVDVLAFIT